MARPGIFLGGVFSFVPGAEVALSKILASGFLVAVFLLRIRALLNPHPAESKARASPLSRNPMPREILGAEPENLRLFSARLLRIRARASGAGSFG